MNRAVLPAVLVMTIPLAGCLGAEQEDGASDVRDDAPGPFPDHVRSNFLGNIWKPSQQSGWQDHFNQITPANAGKWGSVQPMSPFTYFWDAEDPSSESSMDEHYDFAQSNDYPIRYTNLVWGFQQPHWMTPLPPEQQREHIEDWFAAVAQRYPDLDWIEVVNEPFHRPPDCDHPNNQDPQACLSSGDYIDALGGRDGTDGTGYDWVLNAFRLAREHFGPDTGLMLNEYINPGESEVLEQYVKVIGLLKDEDLIDGVGVQQHWHDMEIPDPDFEAEVRDRLAATGLPLQVTELSIAGAGADDEAGQLDRYRRIVPGWWELPSLEGITLWGWKAPMFVPNATLVHEDGSYKPALHWLVAYVDEVAPVITPDQSFDLDSAGGKVVGIVEATDWASEIDRPDLRTFHWRIVGGNGAAGFAVDEATGEITIDDSDAMDSGTEEYSLILEVHDGFHTSDPEEVTIHRP